MTGIPPSTSRSARQRLLGRAVFAGSLLLFLIIGVAMVGDFSAQWWLLLLPVLLLVGPALAVRREAYREAGDGRRSTSEGEEIR